jgi:hypothetical protein
MTAVFHVARPPPQSLTDPEKFTAGPIKLGIGAPFA